MSLSDQDAEDISKVQDLLHRLEPILGAEHWEVSLTALAALAASTARRSGDLGSAMGAFGRGLRVALQHEEERTA